MYAVIKTGGKQYKVSQGDTIRVEKLSAAEGDSVSFSEVLAITDGDQLKLGSPYVEGTSVTADVIRHGRAKKIEIVKFKRRKHHRKQMGHRQSYTELQITAIGGKAAPATKTQKAATKSETKDQKSALLGKADGTPDDLKQLSTIGPKLEEKLNDAGLFHYRQFAELSADEIAKIEEECKIKGRFEKESWVAQAAKLLKEQS